MLTTLLALGLAATRPALPAPDSTPPRLVVHFTVDQLRPDYFERFRSQWTGGFRRILEQAAFFSHARQDHAITETAPGHASLLSGRFPAHTGIYLNTRGVNDPESPLVGTTGPGASPFRFRGTGLYDWMLAHDSTTRVLSVSRKDRGAILPVGRALAPVFWYSGGRFTTSRYYGRELPAWVTRFNERGGAARFAGRQWDLLLPADQYTEPDSMPYENGGVDVTFPHRFPATGDSAALRMPSYPWMDSLIFALALEGVRELDLGSRPGHTDLLTVSLSTTDAVGHAFGPDSREIHDMLLRLDRWLGWFMDSLETMVPGREIVYSLGADHGVQSFTEFSAAHGTPGAERVWMADMARALNQEYRARYHVDFDFEFDSGILSADVDALRARGVNVDSLSRALAREAGRRPGVARVFTPATLKQAPDTDREAVLWRHSLPPEHGWLFAGVLKPGYTWQSSGGWANHGSTAVLDVTIPLAIWGTGVRPGHYDRPVRSVDLGPTLAQLIGVRATQPVDGVPIREVVGER